MHRALGVARGVVVHSGAHGTNNAVLLDALEKSGGRLRGIALIHKGMIDHMGRPNTGGGIDAPGFQSLIRLLKSGRGWSKLSAPYRTSTQSLPYVDIVPYARALVAAAPDRLVWGTDWPHVFVDPPVPNTGDLTDLLTTWVPDEAVRKRILVDNPARLYGF